MTLHKGRGGAARACVEAVASWSDGCECGGGHCARAPQSDFGDDGGDVEERKDGVGRRFSGCKLAADIRGES